MIFPDHNGHFPITLKVRHPGPKQKRPSQQVTCPEQPAPPGHPTRPRHPSSPASALKVNLQNLNPLLKSSPKPVQNSFPTKALYRAPSHLHTASSQPMKRSPMARKMASATFLINIPEGIKKKLGQSELVTPVQRQHPFIK